jgi:hypothetical protein
MTFENWENEQISHCNIHVVASKFLENGCHLSHLKPNIQKRNAKMIMLGGRRLYKFSRNFQNKIRNFQQFC